VGHSTAASNVGPGGYFSTVDDLAQLAAVVTDFAAANNLTIVPAVPEHDCGPEVCLGPDVLDLPGFLALAGKLGRGVLYLRAVPFDPGSGDGPPEDPPEHLTKRTGQTSQVSVAFVVNGLVHFWEHQAPWYQEWQELTDRQTLRRGHGLDDEDEPERLTAEERARLASEPAGTILADPRFRAAPRGDRQRLARLAIPKDTDSWVGYDAARREHRNGKSRQAVPVTELARLWGAGTARHEPLRRVRPALGVPPAYRCSDRRARILSVGIVRPTLSPDTPFREACTNAMTRPAALVRSGRTTAARCTCSGTSAVTHDAEDGVSARPCS